MRINTFALGASLLAILSAPALAQNCAIGAGGPIDFSSGGVWNTSLPTATFLSSTVVLPSGAVTIDSVKLNGLSHTWAADLQVILFDPNGDGHNLLVRLNLDNTGACGASCDFGGDYVIVESGGTSMWPATTGSCVSGDIIPPGVYNQYFGSVPTGMWTPGNNNVNDTPLSAIPVIPGGTYELRIYDWFTQDSGSLASWELCSKGPIGTNYCTPAIPNSTGVSATMSAFGSTTVAENNVVLTMSQGTADFGYFLNSQTQGLTVGPGGSSGNLCLAGSIGRHNQPGLVQPGPTFSITLDLTMLPQPAAFFAVLPGDTWNFQAWYRDTGTSNFSDGIEIQF